MRLKLLMLCFAGLLGTEGLASPAACYPPRHKIYKIQIPEVEFTNAPLDAVVDYIRDASVEHDASDEDVEDKGVDILLMADVEAKKQPVTLRLRNVTLSRLLMHVCEMVDMEYRTEGEVVVVSQDAGPNIIRMYPILPSVFPESDFNSEDIIRFFTRCGVPFPEGATAEHLPEIGRLLVGNSSKNLDLLEDVLSLLNVTPNQIEIACRAVVASDAAARQQSWLISTVTNIPSFIAEGETLFSFSTSVSAGRTVSCGSSNAWARAETSRERARQRREC